MRPHAFWAYKNVDGYFVATEQTRAQLIERGVAPELIRVTGIPVDPAIAIPKQSSEARASLQLPVERPVVTLFGGGIDSRHVRLMVEGPLRCCLQGTLIVVAGRNRGLAEEISDLQGTAA